MRHTRTWLFVFLPFLYLAIVLGFVAFQFSKKSDSFSQSLGDLTISGKAAQGGQPAEIVLRGRGLVFPFDSTHFLTADGKDGSTSRLRPVSWAWKDGNVLVTFQQGLQLIFEKSDGGGRSLLIHPVDGEAPRKLAALHIPFTTEGGARMSRSPRGTLAEVARNKDRLLVSVDGVRDRIETDNTFVLTAGKAGFRPVRLDPLAAGVEPDLAWLTIDSADAAAAEASLAKYWDKAYSVWLASGVFSGKFVDALGREALLRGDYPAAVARFQALLSRERKPWGFDGVSYLGNLVELTAQQRRAVEAASSRSQPDWTGQGRLWLDARLYGPAGSADRVKELLLGSKLPEAAPGLLAVFQNLVTLGARQPSEAVSARTTEVAKALASRVVRREGKVYVQSSDGLFDLRSGLLLGRLWLDYSQTLSNGIYGSIGAQLVLSALSWVDPTGKIPEILVTQEGQVVRQEGTLLPEEIYEAVRPAPAQETELPALGPGAFLRTPAQVVTKVISATSARFVLRFPTGMAEHIILAGVPAFDHLTLHGIRWRTDPQFQSYTDGWSYSAATRTLYLKIKHREDLEEVLISFKPEN